MLSKSRFALNIEAPVHAISRESPLAPAARAVRLADRCGAVVAVVLIVLGAVTAAGCTEQEHVEASIIDAVRTLSGDPEWIDEEVPGGEAPYRSLSEVPDAPPVAPTAEAREALVHELLEVRDDARRRDTQLRQSAEPRADGS